jgi:nucleotide-binding universal stress UspA family protein
MYQRILVGTDGSSTAAKAVDRAVDVAASTGATLTILSVGKPDRVNDVVLQEAARHQGTGVAIETKVVEGDAVEGLVAEASAGGFDLLVMGNKGMTGLTRFLRGSVPNKVTHQLPSNLLIVKTT